MGVDKRFSNCVRVVPILAVTPAHEAGFDLVLRPLCAVTGWGARGQ